VNITNQSQINSQSLVQDSVYPEESVYDFDFDPFLTASKVSQTSKRKFSDVSGMQGSQTSRWPQAISSDFLNLKNKVHSDQN